jgi:tripartite-type tricarboxylate transporter receptor subunit TctC
VHVVTPSMPVRTVKDLIALARARPGQLAYGSSGAGSTGHIAEELFAFQSGLKGYEEITFNGLAAPAGTPRDVLTRLRAEVSRVVRLPELCKRYIERGIELTTSASPEEGI